ncbi:MAG: RHS repeat-associated core domain-containing protein [Solirubrobacteraceae bacterium]
MIPLFLDHDGPAISFSGPLAEAAGGVIGEGSYVLHFTAADGSPGSPATIQSGTRSLEASIDGHIVFSSTSICPKPEGPPADGCYALAGSWTMGAQSYGVGTHTITVTAKDWLGNESTKTLTVTVTGAAYEPLGPGSVNLTTGDFKLTSNDVSLSGGLGSLGVSRSYDSRNLTKGAEGPLGPDWTLSLPDQGTGDWQSLTALPGGNVLLTTTTGAQAVFTSSPGNGGFSSPAGYQNLTLTQPNKPEATYELTDAEGNYTQFTLPSTGSLYVPTIVGQASAAGGLDKDTYSFTRTSEGITEPTKVLAPEPSKGACSPTLVKGCRALTFNYATSTTATGEGPTQWGDYKGRLTRVYFTAWDPAKGAMSETTVAQYAFDSKGRLRAEWDPRIEPALKTTYGYEAEEHITSVTPPGQQPWLLHYGASTGDPVTGRLLSVTRPESTTASKLHDRDGRAAPLNTAVPTLSTSTPVIGTTMSVSSTGTWSNEPLAYAYQWQRCSTTGTECAAIEGATNKTYTPQPTDGGYTLKAQVAATNVNGTSTAVTAATSSIAMPAPASASKYTNAGCSGNQTMNVPAGDAIAPNGNLWVADSLNHCVESFDLEGHRQAACSEGLSKPEGVAVTKTHVYISDREANQIDMFSLTCGNRKTFGSSGSGPGGLSGPESVAIDPSENVWVTDTGNNRVEEFSPEGTYITSFSKIGADQLSAPTGIAFDHGDLYITDKGNFRVVIATPTGQLIGQFGSEGSGTGQFIWPEGIATDPVSGDLLVSDRSLDRVQEFNAAGTYLGRFAGMGTGENQAIGPRGVAVNASGAIYLADEGNNRIQKWLPAYSTNNPAPAPPTASGESIWTVDYDIPLSGTGLPEVSWYSKWGQSDSPVEGTAIFPPDEPMGWPASSYKRATITYLDKLGRAVNTALPGGGISTTEYDEHENIKRTLTADNRARALEAGELDENGHKIKERAEQLDTKDTYSEDGSELTSTLGPEHSIKITAAGSATQARKHVRYFYDEGAPSEGSPYRLLTKTIEGAELGPEYAEREQDIRTITKSYSGQMKLGWKLHAPTSVTTSTGTQTLTTSTTYSSTTGEISETKTPAGNLGVQPFAAPEYGRLVGELGHISEPRALVATSDGSLHVLNSGTNTVTELNSAGAFVRELGGTGPGVGFLNNPNDIAIDSKGNTWIADTGNNRIEKFSSKVEPATVFGTLGSGAGQVKEPKGDAVSAAGTIFVSDTGNNRIDKFTEGGVFIEAFGFGVADGQSKLETCKTMCRKGLAGSENGQLNDPRGLALSAAGNLWVADSANNRLDEFTEAGAFLRSTSSPGQHPVLPKDVSVDAAGNVFVADTGENKIQEYSATGGLLWEAGTQGTGTGQFEEPTGIAVASNEHLWIADHKNNRLDHWVPTMLGNTQTHNTQTIYYTSGTEASLPACQNHPEWVGLPCQEQPAVQPEAGLPPLPTTLYTYNVWDEPLTTTDTSGSTTRTTTIGYDKAARTQSDSIVSGTGSPIAATTYVYNELNGALATQSRTTEGVTKKLASELNTLGQLVSYTDADGNTATFTYDEDYRPKTMLDGKGNQAYSYSTTTGLPNTVIDSAAGTFTAASRDTEGNLTSQSYPNGMTATDTINPVGETTGIEYLKTTHCTTNCTWYKESTVPSIHGDTLSQTSSLATAEYAVDQVGRLTESKTTPVGQGCTTLIYGYEPDGNRTSLTTRTPGTGGACATSGGTPTTSTYDTSERLDEEGVTYDAFGNTTALPAADAGGTALTSTFYANNHLATVTQNGETIGYQLDPAERTRETVSTGKTASTVVSHFDGPGDSPAWTEEPINGHWTRNIPGIGGGLEAIQTNNGTGSVAIELTNLHGDVIGSAKDTSETETHLENVTEASEYGVPTVATPPKYSWLGELQRPTELPTGMIAMGARGYVPQLGRFLQADPTPGSTDNPYGYTNENPINEADPTGQWATTTTYNEEAAEPGQSTIPIENFIEAGAIIPPPADIQAEEELAAHPPWNAPAVYTQLQQAEAEAVHSYRMIGGVGQGYSDVYMTYKKNPCAEQHNRQKARECPKESENHHTTPYERCILAAGAGFVLSLIPGLDLTAAEGAIAACSAAVGSPGEVK